MAETILSSASERQVWITKYFRIMVNQQQPEMAKQLGLTRSGETTASPSSADEPEVDQQGEGGKLANFSQYVAPEEADGEMHDFIDHAMSVLPKERLVAMAKAWKAIAATANDNAPLPNWAGIAAPEKAPILPAAEDFDPWPPLVDTMSLAEKQAWMATAANDNEARNSPEYLRRYLPATWTPQLPAVWQSPQDRWPAVLFRPDPRAGANAFSGQPTPPPMSAPRAPRQVNGLDFNALRPPQWLGPAVVGGANQAQYTQQPSN
jgi:hypothetical protein